MLRITRKRLVMATVVDIACWGAVVFKAAMGLPVSWPLLLLGCVCVNLVVVGYWAFSDRKVTCDTRIEREFECQDYY